MRQVKKARIVFFLIGLILGCAILGVTGYFMISQRDRRIDELNSIKAGGRVLAFARDIKANSEILPDDIIEIETMEAYYPVGGYCGVFAGYDGSNQELWNYNHHILQIDANGVESVAKIPFSKFNLEGKVVKADVYKNQPVSDSVLYPDDDIPTESERYVEYNFLQVPSDVVENDYIDVRIQFPTGEDYVVLVGKKVVKHQGANTIYLKLNEDEQLAMGSAIIEAYMDEGVRLYARKYTDPAVQMYDEKLVDLVADYNNGLSIAKSALSSPTSFRSVSGEVAVKTGSGSEPTLADILYNTQYLKHLRVQVAEEVKEAIASNNADRLNYFRAYRYLEDKKLARTYPLKKEVLNLVKTRPNLLQEIVDEFTLIAANNTREDELERLRRQYEEAPYAASLPYGSNANEVKTKESIQQEILSLEEKRKGNIEKKLENELKTQRQERIAYLNSLTGANIQTEE